MSLVINAFVKIKYWVMSWFYTPEDMLDLWIERHVLNLSPRKECTRPLLLDLPLLEKTSSEMPLEESESQSSSGFSTTRDGNNSDISPRGSEIFPYSPLRPFSVKPCISPCSISEKSLSPLSPSVFFDPKVVFGSYLPLGEASDCEASLQFDLDTSCSPESVELQKGTIVVKESDSPDPAVFDC